jgi:glutathione synthase/RimK-type ligase-like ATP-grasp enzyme
VRGQEKRSVALATAAEVPELDAEGQLLTRSLGELGVRAVPAIWDDPTVPWGSFDLVVVRSTWDYPVRREEFLAWAEQVSTQTELLNTSALLAWTTDKSYLLALRAAGVPVVPSVILRPGEAPEHPYLGQEHVVKPTVSAGSKDTLRLGPDEDSRSVEHARLLLQNGRAVLVQPYLGDVDATGETALVYIDGTFSHAARKEPILRPGGELVRGLFAEEDLSPRDPTRAELEAGHRAMDAVPTDACTPPLYARVDLLPSAEGPRVLELELAEPSLFLEHHEGSAYRLAEAIRLRTRGESGRTHGGC